MASSKEYLDYILEQLSGIDDISYRTMMGEYIIYYKGKVIGGIYDNRFLVKETKSSALMLKDAPRLPHCHQLCQSHNSSMTRFVSPM